jgi:hypothetical protein
VSRSRPAATVVLAAVLALAGCTVDVPEPANTGTPAATTGAGEVPEDVRGWADAVCARGLEVREALNGIGEGFDLDALQGAEGLEQARALVESQITGMQGAVEDLRSEIAAAPEHPVAQEARAALEQPFATLDESQRAAVQEAEAALDATSIPEALAAAGSALTAVRSAGENTSELIEPLTGSGENVSPEVNAVFGQSPSCEALNR